MRPDDSRLSASLQVAAIFLGLAAASYVARFLLGVCL